jgi:hypothetical protein
MQILEVEFLDPRLQFLVLPSTELNDDDVDYDQFGVKNITGQLEAQGMRDIAEVRILG